MGVEISSNNNNIYGFYGGHYVRQSHRPTPTANSIPGLVLSLNAKVIKARLATAR